MYLSDSLQNNPTIFHFTSVSFFFFSFLFLALATKGEDFVVPVDDPIFLFPNPNFLCKMKIGVLQKKKKKKKKREKKQKQKKHREQIGVVSSSVIVLGNKAPSFLRPSSS